MDDIYRSQADIARDTFSNPINPGYFNPGWGMNPALLTPSYDAPYRPPYTGSSGYVPFGNPSFMQGAKNVFGPGHDPYWGNPIDNIRPSVQSMATKPFDAMAWAGQNIAMPYLAYSGMAKILGPKSSGFWGMTKGMWAGEGIAAGVGRGFGSGLATSLGARAGVASFAGGVGGLAAGVALPIMAGEAVMGGFNAGIADSYTANRRNTQNLQDNFQNVYFGQGMGHPVSGKGLSGTAASGMATDLTRQGLQDMMFSRSDITDIASMGMKSGLFDNVKANQITRRVKDMTEQIKMVIAISKDPDIKSAIEELSKLNMAGASLSGGRSSSAATAYGQLGGFAAQAGTSIQKLMATVGAQGQYLFQSNGMTPYLGQLAAANSYAGFAAAQRQGLMSPAQLARLGGVEGATQSALTAQVIGAQTPYNMMGVYNRYVAGAGGSAVPGAGQNLTSTLSAFGRSVANDPLQAMGAIGLYGDAAAGADMTAQGSLGLERSAISMMKHLNIRPAGPGGKYTPEQLAGFMIHSMGIPKEQARAYIQQRATEQDSGVFNQRMEALEGQAKEQTRQFLVQNGAEGGWFNNEIYRPVAQGLHNVGETMNENMVAPVTETIGKATDAVAEMTDWWGFGGGLTKGYRIQGKDRISALAHGDSTKISVYRDRALLSRRSESTASMFDGTTLDTSRAKGILSKINELAKNGSGEAAEAARKYISAKSPSERNEALAVLMKNSDQLGRFGSALSAGNSSASQAQANLDILNKTADSVGGSLEQFTLGEKDRSALTDMVSSAMTNGQGGWFNGNIVKNTYAQRMTKKSQTLDLYDLGAASDLNSRIVGAKGDPAKLAKIYSEVKSNPKYAGLLEKAGGKNATDQSIADAVTKYANAAAKTGADTLGSAVYRASDRDKLLAGGDAEASSALQAGLEATGGVVKGEGLGYAGKLTGNEIVDFHGINQGLADQRKALLDHYNKGEMDYSNLMDSFKNIDGVDKFGIAVDKFGKAVDDMKGTSKTQITARKAVSEAGAPGAYNTDRANTQTSNYQVNHGSRY